MPLRASVRHPAEVLDSAKPASVMHPDASWQFAFACGGVTHRCTLAICVWSWRLDTPKSFSANALSLQPTPPPQPQ
jgi:hypothetical protein